MSRDCVDLARNFTFLMEVVPCTSAIQLQLFCDFDSSDPTGYGTDFGFTSLDAFGSGRYSFFTVDIGSNDNSGGRFVSSRLGNNTLASGERVGKIESHGPRPLAPI